MRKGFVIYRVYNISMNKVKQFFHSVSPKIISLTNERFEKTKEVRYKIQDSPDLSTEGDLDNEELIKTELDRWFPDDGIIAEETLSDDSDINSGREWIIDPICGSLNFKNGVKFFCTNIALADNGNLIASCVVDHCREEYIWSVGNQEIFIGSDLFKPSEKTKATTIDVDLTALVEVSKERVQRHEKLVSYLLKNKKYYLTSYNTSLPFAYVALGRLDAYANGSSKVWDLAAANFLIMQKGIVTEMDGKPWTLKSDNCLASIDKSLHQELLNAVLR